MLILLQDNKLSRTQLIQKLRRLVGDKLLIAVIKFDREKVHFLISIFLYLALFSCLGFQVLILHGERFAMV